MAAGQAPAESRRLHRSRGGLVILLEKAPLLLAGGDATEEFDMLHKPEILDKYAGEYLIGTVAESPSSKL